MIISTKYFYTIGYMYIYCTRISPAISATDEDNFIVYEELNLPLQKFFKFGFSPHMEITIVSPEMYALAADSGH